MTAKVLRFLDVDAARWRTLWRHTLDGGAARGPGRPARVVVGESLVLPGLAPPVCGALEVQWFDDVDDAWANQGWLGDELLAEGAPTVVAREVVLRGDAWLERRWRDGGERYKMLTFGKRNPRWTLAELSERWRSEAGRLGGAAIPDDVRGQAYAQDHPVPVDGREWPYDAINEVWFDRLDDLHRRAGYMAARLATPDRSADALMDPATVRSLLVHELAPLVAR